MPLQNCSSTSSSGSNEGKSSQCRRHKRNRGDGYCNLTWTVVLAHQQTSSTLISIDPWRGGGASSQQAGYLTADGREESKHNLEEWSCAFCGSLPEDEGAAAHRSGPTCNAFVRRRHHESDAVCPEWPSFSGVWFHEVIKDRTISVDSLPPSHTHCSLFKAQQ